MVLLRDAPRRPGRREAAGPVPAAGGAVGASQGGGGPQHRAPDVLSGRGGGGAQEDVHTPLPRGTVHLPF